MNGQAMLELAELALGSSRRIMEDWHFQKQMGWNVGWSPDMSIKRASLTPQVKALIWC